MTAEGRWLGSIAITVRTATPPTIAARIHAAAEILGTMYGATFAAVTAVGLSVQLVIPKQREMLIILTMMNNDDPHGCKADYIDEMIDQMEYQRHKFGECDGAKGGCVYCQDDERNNPRQTG